MQGALVLARAMPFMPVAVNLAVVDPGVGGDRRAVAIRTADERIFVGPDNGLLSLAADAASVVGVRALTNPRYHLEPRLARRSTRATSSRRSPRTSRTAPPSTTSATRSTRRRSSGSSCRSPSSARPGSSRPCSRIDRFGNLQLNLARRARRGGRPRARRPRRARLRGVVVLRRRRRDVRGRPAAATCSSTRTRTARTRSRSRAATRAS